MQSKLPNEVLYNSCGGCGATHPSQRCINCFHPFEKNITQEFEALYEQHQQLKERCEKMEAALKELVELKRMSDETPLSPDYLKRKPIAWAAASEALAHKPEGINEKEGEDEFPSTFNLSIDEKKKLLANKIESRMKDVGLYRQEFADLMAVQPSTITRWLSGEHNFEIKTLFEIEKQLNIKLFNL